MAAEGDNLVLVLGAWMDAARAGTLEALASVMDDDVVWYGFVPGTGCRGSHEVLAMLGRNRPSPPRVTRLEAVETGDTVAVCLESPDFRHPLTGEPRPAAFLRLAIAGGRITEMRGVATREEALHG
jgi:hypothetical protein